MKSIIKFLLQYYVSASNDSLSSGAYDCSRDATSLCDNRSPENDFLRPNATKTTLRSYIVQLPYSGLVIRTPQLKRI